MRILILSQFFDPEPTPKGLAFARELVRRGHEVEVLTGWPNYPGGAIYPGYALRFFRRTVTEGIRVNRVWLYPSHDRSAVRRVGNYTSFALSALLAGPFVTRRPDIIYAYQPPATIGLPALALGALWRRPVVLDIQDMWPDTLASTGMLANPVLLSWIGRYCKFLYRHASHLVVLSDGFRRLLRERGIPDDRITVIRNWADEAALGHRTSASSPRALLGLEDRLVVMFAGNMGAAQGLDSVLDAACLAMTRLPSAVFVFVGGGIDAERLAARAADMKLDNVRFIGHQPMEHMGPWLQMADVLLVHLRDDPLFEITIPSKTQAYLAAGRPVLMAVKGDAATLVEAARAGIACEPENPESLIAALQRLHDLGPAGREQMGAAGLRYYRDELSLGVGVAAFERVFYVGIHAAPPLATNEAIEQTIR